MLIYQYSIKIQSKQYGNILNISALDLITSVLLIYTLKMVNEKITPEGLFTYVFYALCEEGDNGMEYVFLTNSDGDHVAKTPLGMFKDKKIPNDVAEILKVIDDYNNGDDDSNESSK